MATDPDDIRDFFWPAAAQRLAQALGALSRLSAEPATARFAVHIRPALTMLQRALSHLDGLDDFKWAVWGEDDPAGIDSVPGRVGGVYSQGILAPLKRLDGMPVQDAHLVPVVAWDSPVAEGGACHRYAD